MKFHEMWREQDEATTSGSAGSSADQNKGKTPPPTTTELLDKHPSPQDITGTINPPLGS